MNPIPDYSSAYVMMSTDAADREHWRQPYPGTGSCSPSAAEPRSPSRRSGPSSRWWRALAVDDVLADLGGFWRRLVHDSHLRWLGPEKGVMHMAIGAVVNAVWDLYARRLGMPLWQALSRLTPEQLVDLIDFRHLTDAIDRAEALDMLERAAVGRDAREAALLADGYPAYTTSAGWLGYSDEKVARLSPKRCGTALTTSS